MISSSLALALGLTVPAWAQLGRVGVGHSGLSSSTDRLGIDAHDTQQGSLKGSTQTTDSSQAKVNTGNKSKVKADANTEAGASANAKVKKQKGRKNNSPDVMINSDTSANVDANAQAQTTVQ